jgi:CBS domain-containing protein
VLKTYKFGALPVVHEGRLVGIVTVSDILDSYISLLSAHEKEVRP